jgi:hypothetical protein
MMKTTFFSLIFMLIATISFAQSTTEAPKQNISMDSTVVYRLFATNNIYNFIKFHR